MRVNIGQKLTLSFLLVALVVGVLGFSGYSDMRITGKQVDVIGEELQGLAILTDIKSQIIDGIRESLAYTLFNDPSAKSEYVEYLVRFDASASLFLESAYLQQDGQGKETALFNEIVIAQKALAVAAGNMINGFERGGVINGLDIVAFEAETRDVFSLIDQFLAIERQEVDEAQENIQATIARAERQTLILVSVSLALAIGLGFVISRSIATPINRLRRVAEELGKGDLYVRADIDSRDEIGSLAESFNQMADLRQEVEEQRRILIKELEVKNAELEQFAYTVSHDLKSPLITIKGFLGSLQQNVTQGQTERLQADMDRITSNADRMAEMLDEILVLSRIGRVVGVQEEMLLFEVAQDAVDMVDGIADERNVKVTVASGLPVVFGDRIKIREVLQNLVENSIKFMGEEPDPAVEIGALQKNGESICFVRDNGIGINPRYNHKVFDLFEKLDQNTAGSGVGLALVKRIVEVHGGRIWVESEGLGHGSTFYFTLPSKGGAQNNDSV